MAQVDDVGAGAAAQVRETGFGPALRALAVVAAVLVVLGPVVRILVDAVLVDPSLPQAWLAEARRQTDLDGEANLPATFSAALFGLVALGLLALAGLRRAAGQRARPVVVLAVVAAYLGLDEACELHESLALVADHLHATAGLANFAWLVPGVALAAVGGAVVLRSARALPPRLRRRLVVAGAVFLLGAVVLEYASSLFLVDLPGTEELTAAQPVAYVLVNALEEGTEMVGALLALAAVLAELRLRVGGGEVALVAAPAPPGGAAVGRTGGSRATPSPGGTPGTSRRPAGGSTVHDQAQSDLRGREGAR